MKTKLVVLLILLLVINSVVFASVGDYERKSVTSLDTLWVQPEAARLVSSWSFDLPRFYEFLSFYLEVPRFDYNLVDERVISAFQREANSMSEYTPATIAAALEDTVIPQIVKILNNPEVQALRSGNYKDESDYQTLAATKAKALGLTLPELQVYLNSAYIYLPYLSRAALVVDKKGNRSIELEGGILWWQVKTDDSGNISLIQVLSAETSTFGLVDDSKYPPKEFVFGAEKWPVSPVEYAVNDAMLAFAKNLSVKTKEIDAFKLSAQVVEKENSSYGFGLGSKEGIHLDDGFFIVEYVENTEGEPITVKKGFARVSKTADNMEDSAALSYATYVMGKSAEIGDSLMEHPRLGADVSIDFDYTMGSNITTSHVFNAIAEDAKSIFNINTSFAYNLAPITNISQLFATLDVGIGIPVASPAGLSGSSTLLAFVTSPYLGISKSFGGRAFVNGSLGIGLDTLVVNYSSSVKDLTISVYSLGLKLGIAGGYMITPDLSIVGKFGYKLNMPPITGTYKLNGVKQDFVTSDYTDLNLGGASISVGVRYAIGQLPFNLFGFLDPFKKY